MKRFKNFCCAHNLHIWKDIYLPIVFHLGTVEYDTTNQWRKCKNCNKTQMRNSVYNDWINK